MIKRSLKGVSKLLRPLRQVLGSYRRRKKERAKAMRRQRELDALFADIITWGAEEAVFTGKISRQEANQKYTEFGTKMGIVDLLPKKQQMLRKDIYNLKKKIVARLDKEPTEKDLKAEVAFKKFEKEVDRIVTLAEHPIFRLRKSA